LPHDYGRGSGNYCLLLILLGISFIARDFLFIAIARDFLFIARDFLFHPLGSLPGEGPGSEGVQLLGISFLLIAIARDFLFHPLGSLPGEGPGSEGVQGEVGGDWGHRWQESPDLAG